MDIRESCQNVKFIIFRWLHDLPVVYILYMYNNLFVNPECVLYKLIFTDVFL